jgi:hypothetical protein
MAASRWTQFAGVLALGLLVSTTLPAQEVRTVRMSGLFLGSWSMDLGPEAASNNRFEVNRAYLTFSGALSERVSGRITTDAIREDGEELEVRLKYAFATYQIPRSALAVRFGLTQTPFVEFEEGIWEHRMQGSIPADRLRFLSSSDLGVAVDGSWGEGGQTQVSAGVYNGEGWAVGEGDSGKDLMARVTVRLASTADTGPLGGLRLTGYGQVGSPVGGGVRRRALGMLSWRAPRVTLATQFLATRDRSDGGLEVPGPVRDGTLFNSFAVVKPGGTDLVLIGRLELFDPDRQVAGDNQTRWTGGVGFRLAPELRVLAAVEHLRYEAGAPTPALDASRVRALMHVALTF